MDSGPLRPKQAVPTTQGREDEKGPEQRKKGDCLQVLLAPIWTCSGGRAPRQSRSGFEHRLFLVWFGREVDEVPPFC